MSTEVTTKNLQINILSKEQYKNETPKNDELYFVEDVRNVFILDLLEQAPTTANVGDKYYSTTDKKIYTYNGDTWVGETPEEDLFYIALDTKFTHVWDGNDLIAVGGFTGYDDKTIVMNNEKIQTVGIIDQNSQKPKYNWVGSEEEYKALEEYHDDWLYYIDDLKPKVENMSLTNILNRLNPAHAWIYRGETSDEIVFTVPLPSIGYTIYSDVNLSEISKVVDVGEMYISDGDKQYNRYETYDSVFNGASEDSKNQIVTVYDLIKAFRG